jgi:uncharacterized protein
MTIAPPGRIVTLDIIRGIAVMGIFSVNVVAFAMIEEAYLNPGAFGGHTGADLFVWAANLLLVDGKMRSLFSMLFGASMLLVIDRAEETGRSGLAVHVRRMLILLGFGLLHYFLLWFGDILTLYAVSGLVAVLFRHRSPERLVAGGSAAILVGMILFGFYINQQHAVDLAAHRPHATLAAITEWNDNFGTFYPTPQVIASDIAVHRGRWWGLVSTLLDDWPSLVSSTLVFVPETVGLMMLGMAGYKSGFLTGQWSDRHYRTVALTTVPLGFVAFAVLIAVDVRSHLSIITLFGGFIVAVTPFRVAMAAGYAALIILAARKQHWLASRIAATGRAAFSNYLGTSLVATFVFYGWGLGLYGSVSRAQVWLLVPIVWLLMLAWSKPWLDRFHYGPLEWLWRSLARGRFQPMRKT